MKAGKTTQRPTLKAKSGFTLIELLVVIAIIAILAAILFPVFARARENARRASCQSNVKQIMLGVLQYTQDYDEKYPPAYVSDASGTPVDGWYNLTQPYLKSTQIYKCPSDSSTTISSFTNRITPAGFVVSYAQNYRIGGETIAISLASVQSPATLVYMSDAGATADGPNGTVKLDSAKKEGGARMLADTSVGASPGLAAGTNPDFVGPSPRHLETTVTGYADGHVKSVRPNNWYYFSSWQMSPTCSSQTGTAPCL